MLSKLHPPLSDQLPAMKYFSVLLFAVLFASGMDLKNYRQVFSVLQAAGICGPDSSNSHSSLLESTMLKGRSFLWIMDCRNGMNYI